MESTFWTLLENYKKTKDASEILAQRAQFTAWFDEIHQLVNAIMFSEATENDEGESIFNNIGVAGDGVSAIEIGADDAHDELSKAIIWKGKTAVENFLRDPSSAMYIARELALNLSKDDADAEFYKLIYDE